ncbi:uncharacterized protein MKZ38_003538 [Zalerion maritima]|uniref:Uncharacterized protein n=1 Tax=Zalerion maritima TaxID=339359 RepID=A0AAD5WSC4_9PEZI|nr:uncharacterized protein MKZ38_003538 [Zalerion maritima]
MPPFIDRVHLYQAVSSQAVPVLEAMAANDNLRSLRRFERDDPPPYVSSTESEELDDADLIPPPQGRPMPEELKAIMERPIDEKEIDSIPSFLHSVVRPDDFYHTEAMSEKHRLDGRRGPRPKMFTGLDGARRQGVIVRHNIKRRWGKLGVWNPKWGFAGRKIQPNDNFRRWTWWWQPDGAADNWERAYQDARELIARALRLRLRQNLPRGEHVPIHPRSRLGQDTTVAQAEAFLISRPWFIFRIELAEEMARYDRLSVEDQTRYPYSARNQVIKWWKERGDWKDEYDRTSLVTSWKWRQESPSPEPEDLTPIDNMQNSPLDAAANMEFTPSEIDELETIELPRSEQPEGFWVIEEGDMWPSFPGQMIDNEARIRKREEERAGRLKKARAEGREAPVNPAIKFFKEKFPGPLFRRPQPVNEEVSTEKHKDEPLEPQEDASEPQRDAAYPPPQKKRPLHRRHPRNGVDRAQDQDQLPPLPRRSARIAGMKRPAEPLPSQTAPNKRPRGRAPKPAAPVAAPTTQPPLRETRNTKSRLVPARPPPKGKTETRPRHGPGRSRKENGPSMRSAAGKKKPAGIPAPAGTRSGKAA